jgi:hypothetical protein
VQPVQQGRTDLSALFRLHLCSEHLILDIEAKAKKAIRKNRWLASGDRIAVALSGNPSSAAVLLFLRKLVGKEGMLNSLPYILIYPALPEIQIWRPGLRVLSIFPSSVSLCQYLMKISRVSRRKMVRASFIRGFILLE